MTNFRKKGLHILKKQLLVALLCIPSGYSFAQVVTTFRGTVLDASSKEPLPAVVISFDNTTIASYSNENDGSFSISNRRNFTKVTISLMGYKTQKYTIAAQQTTNMQILLESTDTWLTEVVVKPKKEKYSKKDNPAVELIKKVIANKSKNNIRAQNYYQYKEYERYIFAFNDFNPESGQFKKYKFLPNYVDTSIIDRKPFLPFSVKEKVTDVFYRNNPKTEKKIVKGYKTEGIDQKLEQQGIEAFIQETFKDVNIFDNYISLLLQNFVGPLSDQQAVSFYKWYLGDTVKIEDERYVRLDFAPFNNRDIGFTGNIFVALDSSYAVKKAILRAPNNINVNWVTDMVVHQDFKKDENGVWVPQEYRTAMDLSIYDALKLYVDKTITVEDFVANMPISPVYDLPDPVLFEKDYKKRTDQFWIANRPHAHQTDYRMDELVNEMKDVFFIKLFLNLGNILMTGYVPLDKDPDVNKLEIGTVPTVFSYNRVEGARFRVTGSTTRNFHPNLFLYGYGAYGTKDGKFKYASEATWAFNKVKGHKEDYPVNNLSVGYKYDMNALGQRFTQAERDNILMSLNSSKKSRLTYNRQISLRYHKEYHSGFSFKIQAQTSDEKPAQGIVFEKHDAAGNVTVVNKIKMTDASVSLRYTHNEKFFQQRRRRIPIPTERFVTELSHAISLKDFMGGQYSFNKTSLSIGKDFWITPYGKLNVNARAEKLWGKAPFISLITPSSNSSFTLQSGSFYLIEPLEFVHDEQVSWEVYYHMGGWLFNRIPLLKSLKWREVFGFRGFYGKLSKKNNPEFNHDQLVFPEDSYQTGSRPYLEYNIGIENIFNFFRIDYVRRVNYLDHPDINKHGFRFSFQFEF